MITKDKSFAGTGKIWVIESIGRHQNNWGHTTCPVYPTRNKGLDDLYRLEEDKIYKNANLLFRISQYIRIADNVAEEVARQPLRNSQVCWVVEQWDPEKGSYEILGGESYYYVGAARHNASYWQDDEEYCKKNNYLKVAGYKRF